MGNIGGPDRIISLIVFVPIGVAIWAQMRWSTNRRSADNDSPSND